MKMTSPLRTVLLAGASLLHCGHIMAAPPSSQSPAYAALMHGRVQEAADLSHKALAANAGDGAAHLLLCRAAFAQELVDEAATECEKAAAAQPNDSETQMWLGRALGLKASHVNPLSAFPLARRVHDAFEAAARLDSSNIVAASDLGQFYIGAPGIVGGGQDKLEALAATMMAHAPARAHRLLALMAQKKKDYPKAEAEFKLAIAAGKHPESYSDLALFYQQRNRPDDAATFAAQALAADTNSGPVDFDVATILISAKRTPDIAERAMHKYLDSPNQTDDAPVFKVHLELGKLLAGRGDKAGARAEYAAAVALAPRYEPARKALASV